MSNLRPNGAQVSNSAGSTTGAVSFMNRFSNTTREVAQNGRRGALMLTMDIAHPDIEEFITIKQDLTKVTGANISVRLSDEFMKAVEKDEEFGLRSPHNKKIIEKISARALWIKILTARVETGEPYILFIDSVNRSIPEHHKKLNLNVKTSNLCSEITLPTGLDHLNNERTAVCCLSSLNLEFYENWKDHPQIIEDIMRFLDNVLQDFIDKAPDSMSRAKYSATRHKSWSCWLLSRSRKN